MKEYKNFLINQNKSPIEKLKEEIDLRYRIYQYKKLQREFLLNRIEKNNYNLIMKCIEDMNIYFSNLQ